MKVGDLVQVKSDLWLLPDEKPPVGIVISVCEQKHIDIKKGDSPKINWKTATMTEFAEVAFGCRKQKYKQEDLQVVSEKMNKSPTSNV